MDTTVAVGSPHSSQVVVVVVIVVAVLVGLVVVILTVCQFEAPSPALWFLAGPARYIWKNYTPFLKPFIVRGGNGVVIVVVF